MSDQLFETDLPIAQYHDPMVLAGPEFRAFAQRMDLALQRLVDRWSHRAAPAATRRKPTRPQKPR